MTKKELARTIANAYFPEDEGDSPRKAKFVTKLMYRTKTDLEYDQHLAHDVLATRSKSAKSLNWRKTMETKKILEETSDKEHVDTEQNKYEAYYQVTEAMRSMMEGGCSKEQLVQGRDEWMDMFLSFVEGCIDSASTDEEIASHNTEFKKMMDEITETNNRQKLGLRPFPL